MKMDAHSQQNGRALRLQIFVNDLSATGVVRNAIAIANEATARGYQVRMLTCRTDGVLRNQIHASVALVELIDRPRAKRSRHSDLKQAFFAYRRHSRRWQPDVMLSAGNHGHLLSTFAWLGLPGTKVLRMSNDLSHGAPNVATRLWRDVKFRLMARLADKLVLVSHAHGTHPLLAPLRVAGKAVVIPNGVDVVGVRAVSQHPCQHPWAEEKSVPIVLAVGRHVKQKNFDTLLKGFAKARREQPMRLIILGDGDPAASARLHDLAARLGVDRDVHFVPATPNPFPYMAAASVLALPSLWEGSSNVLLEAMACGTPVIAARLAGDAELVLGEGRYGVLFDARDEDELAKALMRQVSPRRIEPNGRAYQFDRSRTVSCYLRLFDRLTSETASNRRDGSSLAGGPIATPAEFSRQ